MIPTVKIRDLRQSSLVYGSAQAAIGKAIMKCVEDGIIPKEAAEDLMIVVNVFVHHPPPSTRS